MAAITRAGETLIAQKTAKQEVLVVSKFIFALVPGLNPELPVDRNAPKPAANRVVYEQAIAPGGGGYVNPNQVVYSAMIGSNVGDWDFNWIGLETAEGVLLAVAYMPIQQKRKNIPNRQTGNNITRNILLMFDGAQSITHLTIDASTWQADFTVRLAGIDERERNSNRDFFGRACFFDDSLKLYYQSGAYKIKPGTAYIEGLCVKQVEASLPPKAPPFTAWYDVSLQRHLNETKVMLVVRYGDHLADYLDSDDTVHYLVPAARVVSSNNITDLRDTVAPIQGAVLQYLAARTGDYEFLRARATTKEDVGLGNLPNATSDDPNSDSSDILVTTAVLKYLANRTGDYEHLRARATTKEDIGLGNLPNATSDDPNSDSSDILATTAVLKYLANRTGDYEHLRARATTKEDVGLGKLPNAKSDDPASNSSDILATTAALHKLKLGFGTAALRTVGTELTNIPEYLEGGLSGYGYGSKEQGQQVIDFDTFVSVNGQTVSARSTSSNGPPGLNRLGGIAEFFHSGLGCVIQRVTFTSANEGSTSSPAGEIWQRSRYSHTQSYGRWVTIFHGHGGRDDVISFGANANGHWRRWSSGAIEQWGVIDIGLQGAGALYSTSRTVMLPISHLNKNYQTQTTLSMDVPQSNASAILVLRTTGQGQNGFVVNLKTIEDLSTKVNTLIHWSTRSL